MTSSSFLAMVVESTRAACGDNHTHTPPPDAAPTPDSSIDDIPLERIRFVTGRADVRALLPEVLERISSAAQVLEPIVTSRVSWDFAPEAWLAPATKLVVTRA